MAKKDTAALEFDKWYKETIGDETSGIEYEAFRNCWYRAWTTCLQGELDKLKKENDKLERKNRG